MSVALVAGVPTGIGFRIASHPLEQGCTGRTVTS